MKVTDIDISEYDYPLPDDRIAKHPLAVRDSCRLLHRVADGGISDYVFTDIPDLLAPDSLLVCNNTKVINARIHFPKTTGAIIEIFCLEPHMPVDYAQSFASVRSCSWKCFVGNSKRWRDGVLNREIEVAGRHLTLHARRLERIDKASIIEFGWDADDVTFSQIVDAIGEIPIPPYLNRASEASDAEDYQTVYSRVEGSVAAPTAGLHFTDRVLDACRDRGIEVRELTLHVGAGTFQPVQTDKIGEHVMHRETIEVPLSLIDELASTDCKIVAVGTTSVRTLESLYHLGIRSMRGEAIDELPQWSCYSDDDVSEDMPTRGKALAALAAELRKRGHDRLVAATRIIIAPGYKYRVVDNIITNFHQPCSTLLLLVSAFTGGDWRRMYMHALESGYRFLSYGDAMLLS